MLYSAEVDTYEPRCRPCHRALDAVTAAGGKAGTLALPVPVLTLAKVDFLALEAKLRGQPG